MATVYSFSIVSQAVNIFMLSDDKKTFSMKEKENTFNPLKSLDIFHPNIYN